MTSLSSLYVHVPFCRHLCNYCDFYKKKFDNPHAQREEFAQYLRNSWKRHESIMADKKIQWAPLETLYFGGGTPSLWGIEGARDFQSIIGKNLTLKPNAEVTFEVDPGAWNSQSLLAWEGLGVNRFSVGTQALDDDFLKILDRAHNREETFKLLEHLKGKNFSVDFLLGSPVLSKKRDVLSELRELLSYSPKHVSLYILQPAAGYSLKKNIPDDEIVGSEYILVSEFLRSQGFHHYEVSNFALPGFESKHNLRYWHGENVAALGPTGTGYFSLSPSEAFRYKWKPSQAEIEEEILTKDEIDLERMYLRLRISAPFLESEISEKPGLKKVLLDWKSRGLIEQLNDAWRMKPESWVVLDSLMNELFSALK
ncbi:MAG: coproporphyrinogen III oxidase family protein [Bacteriovoracaceae bacterium]|nr:coproporphyrinogen III oxidase family protein [Bacteriovoracaceae bacterium]